MEEMYPDDPGVAAMVDSYRTEINLFRRFGRSTGTCFT